MTKVKYYFIVLILTFFACKSSSVQQSGPGDDSGGKDTTRVTTLEPIKITLPEADFTDPKFIAQGKPSEAINGRLEGLINATPKGASIYLSVYGFREAFGLISAIRKANDRGVNLHVMLDRSDRSSNTPTVNKLAAISGNIDIVGIINDASSSAINHNKFALFSNLKMKNGEAKNVVFTSSENWTPHSKKELQNAIILSHKGLYEAYQQYWQDMKSRADFGMVDFKYREFSTPEDGIRALFYPKRKGGEYYGPDTIGNILDNITDPSSTTIQIEMPFWTNGRIAVVNKLSDLMNQGAEVEIVVRSNVPVHDALVDLGGLS